ncbi:hypothetical protein ART_3886 [Arthrobacter sp. PAMC 25486]|uniref:protealysin inhibitor emfourin n=1 Tax=Arthrobacter sp. PAMC 25486 TaxID=1494608 RepID=UPI000535E563|nr:protealysin inhibitor emfourin [Arthrobacter sp. PAMC 25486]AIY03485.1 hypothetical protein ART_3886 [Arthrobacter sp. PAMC 25486]
MKLTIIRGGGIAGIVARTELDAQALPEPAAKAFAQEVARANLDSLPAPADARRWPDAQLYEISVESTEHSFKVRCTDDSMPENVRLLVAWVDSRPERIDSIE